ncbi:hypothetical protein H257_13347 [Aphanomyces astaci]|uniref:Calcineurin-like phosphoesterase domain-containing protein n=1 Tax=Aphanomyces astaci TaxID=112090 RepID=W4FVF1_APHAT|nr:hypothetical protein H257_13347 [Aphanomyces astaci]ETV71472.1 hypothetical protein H257_13347 [Aphanomyces astaci]|eukprot:XP_009839138.1 hypothetical protein H257_13347 [Aphanomyces astaci]
MLSLVLFLCGWVLGAVDQLTDHSGAELSVHFLAIGDWGSTVAKAGGDSSCCSQYHTPKSEANYTRDLYAQANIGMLMGQSAKLHTPQAVLAHGDSFYWNGVGPDVVNTSYRFENTFEAVYNHPDLVNVPWLNVMGNHDYGGSGFICGEEPCPSPQAIRRGLQLKFQAQHTYKSPASDRWHLDHWFKSTFRQGNVSVDVLSVDTNGHANVHGATHICCQCYGYLSLHPQKSPSLCANPVPGEALCAGGDVALYLACMDELVGYANASLAFVETEAKQARQVDWKIVNSHFAPHYHMDPQWQSQWLEALRTAHLLVHGHTHGANHVKMRGCDGSHHPVHFVENGAGGGIIAEAGHATAPAGMDLLWVAPQTPYGFFELAMSKTWLRLQFVTFDSQWNFGSPSEEGQVVGGRSVLYCTWIPHPGLGPAHHELPC